MPTPTPTFRELTRDECIALLDRHQVGRLAFSQRERLDVEPIHYVHLDGWLYGRTQPGTKLEVLLHNRWVAFEVDEVDALFDWRSVVVRGGLYLLRAEGSDVERERYAQGIAAVRRLIPEAFTPRDPTPERAILFRIHVDEMSGRAAATA
ncbi:MAG: pyridoxamine 5'-phosphate oxidase family protein [Gemmatimonadota bacterium]|jgi:nitroimidazol reductase NimA-like FMN-containing flavoprotein (pyridoxamine 5'-phosphate oxidase superfamily)|nr:pyridoxamine 5'-phosphate oxidase family protein [Gemmatimonadota bacterium]MDQ8147422.1 pyridoxamine 5'-phosphate oxidase family protein [Gemmatimonadota bacterium]MDQ8149192.1 pyridoxamine 5'-phosphate oxidase family protein [Gemmatimonadota bacterium]MDQ8155937.1 pyridoxamine 5'-phosphate oxidase family protein [Gemmatimonadota bacterium]MDQ8176826.1 pyridoxamine 5'-phosphate oxidase family protein [Gemmatimonadota bacterium]